MMWSVVQDVFIIAADLARFFLEILPPKLAEWSLYELRKRG